MKLKKLDFSAYWNLMKKRVGFGSVIQWSGSVRYQKTYGSVTLIKTIDRVFTSYGTVPSLIVRVQFTAKSEPAAVKYYLAHEPVVVRNTPFMTSLSACWSKQSRKDDLCDVVRILPFSSMARPESNWWWGTSVFSLTTRFRFLFHQPHISPLLKADSFVGGMKQMFRKSEEALI